MVDLIQKIKNNEELAPFLSKTCCENEVCITLDGEILEEDYVVIKVENFITPIKIAEGLEISDNFKNYNYCIVKEGISQYIDEACEFDKNLYYILKKYCFLREAYKIKVGDVVKVKGKSYNFTVENIVSDTAYLVNAFGSKLTINKSLLVHAQTPKFEKIIPKKITL